MRGSSPRRFSFASPDEYPYVATKPWHGSQKKVAEDESSVTIEFDVIINYELEQKILSWGDYVEVLQPDSLVDIIRHRLTTAVSIYDNSI